MKWPGSGALGRQIVGHRGLAKVAEWRRPGCQTACLQRHHRLAARMEAAGPDRGLVHLSLGGAAAASASPAEISCCGKSQSRWIRVCRKPDGQRAQRYHRPRQRSFGLQIGRDIPVQQAISASPDRTPITAGTDGGTDPARANRPSRRRYSMRMSTSGVISGGVRQARHQPALAARRNCRWRTARLSLARRARGADDNLLVDGARAPRVAA